MTRQAQSQRIVKGSDPPAGAGLFFAGSSIGARPFALRAKKTVRQPHQGLKPLATIARPTGEDRVWEGLATPAHYPFSMQKGQWHLRVVVTVTRC